MKLDALAYRTVRCAQSVESQPSLQLGARLTAGVPGCAPGGCLLQAQLRNAAAEALAVVGLACPSAAWRLAAGGAAGLGDGSMQVGSDASAALHCQLVPAGDAAPAAAAAAHDLAAAAVAADSSSSGLSEAEAGLLEMSRRVAAALPKHLQPPAEQQQQRQKERQRRRQQREHEGGTDVVVLWQARSRDGGMPRRGFCCVHNQRCVGTTGAAGLAMVTPEVGLQQPQAACLCLCPCLCLSWYDCLCFRSQSPPLLPHVHTQAACCAAHRRAAARAC